MNKPLGDERLQLNIGKILIHRRFYSAKIALFFGIRKKLPIIHSKWKENELVRHGEVLRKVVNSDHFCGRSRRFSFFVVISAG